MSAAFAELPRVQVYLAGTQLTALVDTGANLSAMEARCVPNQADTQDLPGLVVGLANRSTITCERMVTVTFRLGQREFKHDLFVLPCLPTQMLLGTDFFRRHGLDVSFTREGLIDSARMVIPFLLVGSMSTAVSKVPKGPSLVMGQRQVEGLTAVLLPEYFATAEKPFGRARNWVHRIDTGAALPVTTALRRHSPEERAIIEREVEKMLAMGAIRPSRSPWSSAVSLQPKKDGTTRFCIDYRRLNEVTTKDEFPLPRIDDMLDALDGASWFCSLDAASGYWQIPVAEEDIPKTAFKCTSGLYEWVVMPFGLCNAPATYQRMKNSLLSRYTWRGCLVYIDDILVYGRTFEEMLNRLVAVLRDLFAEGLLLKATKCAFGERKLEWLGYDCLGGRNLAGSEEGRKNPRLPGATER